MVPGYDDQSSVITAFGLLIALIAILGTQFLGWVSLQYEATAYERLGRPERAALLSKCANE